MRPDDLPVLDARTVQKIPGSLARKFRLIPVKLDGDRLVIVCSQPLTEEDVETLKFMSHREHFEFVTDTQAYPEVRRHLDLLLKLYFPLEGPGFLSSPDLPRESRSR
jgi:hypothetical protein